MKKVLVLFTCHNRLAKTQRCIESLTSDTSIKWKFIIVDDNSTDGTKEYLKTKSFVNYISGNGNLFYSKGMRVAIASAKEFLSKEQYDYVLLVNDDVDFFPNSITQLINYLDGENAVMVGVTSDDNGNMTYGGIIKASKWKPKFIHVMSDKNKIMCDTLNANCVLIPQKLFMLLDNIDDKYWHTFGDYDYGFNVIKQGFVIYTSNFYVGICNEDHSIVGTWQDSTLSVKTRFDLKEKPTGNPTKIWFYFLKKNYNVLTAILYTFNDYLKILIK